MGCHFLLQGIFPDPGIEPWSPALKADSLPLSHQGSFLLASFFTSSTLLHRPHGCTSNPNSKISGPKEGREGCDRMHTEHGPWENVLVPTRPSSGAAAAPFLSRCWHSWGRQCTPRVQCFQKEEGELPSDPGVCHHQPDVCVPLRQQWIHSTARPHPLCTKRADSGSGVWGDPESGPEFRCFYGMCVPIRRKAGSREGPSLQPHFLARAAQANF